MGANMVPIIGLGIILIFGGVVYIFTKKQKNADYGKDVSVKDAATEQNAYKKNVAETINKDDVFNFMEFDKIQDDMIIQQNGEKYTAVIKCKGINYNLMSEVEQLSIEEGFINFLNTLKFPIQLYVQAQNVNLKDNINKYEENMKNIHEEFDELNMNYQIKMNSLDVTEEELEQLEKEKSRALNVVEYGKDIIKYVERLNLNKNMLQRNFYVLVSYYKSEISNVSNFKKSEIQDICYSELFTRVQNIVSGLSMSSVNTTILSSDELAELVYSAFNRDDSNYIDVSKALESGFHRLYSTSKDAITKKHQMLVESIRKEAEYKAVEALSKAIEEGNITTMQDVEDEFDQESSKQAIDFIKNEKIDDAIKSKARKIIIDEYKKAKKDRLEKKAKEVEQILIEAEKNNVEVNAKEKKHIINKKDTEVLNENGN